MRVDAATGKSCRTEMPERMSRRVKRPRSFFRRQIAHSKLDHARLHSAYLFLGLLCCLCSQRPRSANDGDFLGPGSEREAVQPILDLRIPAELSTQQDSLQFRKPDLSVGD